MELFGINYWSYPDEERAVKLADEKIRKNRADFPWINDKIKQPELADIFLRLTQMQAVSSFSCGIRG